MSPSSRVSSTPVTVTVCGTFQFAAVKVSEAGATVPSVTSLELMPTVTLFGVNEDPFQAGSSKQKPLFILEGHVTRGFTPGFWGSLDLLWREGGEVRVDGRDIGNSQSALSLGGTTTFSLGSGASLRFSAGGVVARNAHGPNGWMLRTILGTVF